MHRVSDWVGAARRGWRRGAFLVGWLLVAIPLLSSCGGSSASADTATGGGGASATRSFRMGASPFFATATAFPDFRFENMGERDLISLHVDDFWGVPWEQCVQYPCSGLPQAWVTRWEQLAQQARSSSKPVYLALSPLGGRRTLAAPVRPDGSRGDENWAPRDANGCYQFASDPNAQRYAQAYVNYLRFVLERVQPAYLSPGVEINMVFTTCAAQKQAWMEWYRSVHQAIKLAYPQLPVFATFQMEYMYGIAEANARCPGGLTAEACFDRNLVEVLQLPGDRLAVSTYPAAWRFERSSLPQDSFAKMRQATQRRLWVSETGWPTQPVLQSYAHASSGQCGAVLMPSSIASEAQQDAYLGWLLGQAQAHQLEVVVWWLNRDYLDDKLAPSCPCPDPASETCRLLATFQAVGGDGIELLTRLFGNMALRRYDGSARPAQQTWQNWFNRRLQ